METAEATKNYIIDFDSTFTSVEALDVLGEIALDGNESKDDILDQIKLITDKGMDGTMSLKESIEERLQLVKANKDHLPILVKQLKKKVSKSFKRNKKFLKEHAENVYIISNGFKEFIYPIVAKYGIKEENVHANTFIFNKRGRIIGFDTDSLLANNKGKPAQIKALNLEGEVYVIGDGYTDYEIKEQGLADKFYAFTENIDRPHVSLKADHVAPSLDEFLYHNKMDGALSYPKNRIKVLLLENVHDHAVSLLKDEGYQVEILSGSLSEDELIDKIKDVSILGIRSKTMITKKVLESANRLIAIGAFCIGTNQIDLEECLKNGVAVFNAPYSNTRSVVELAISEMILLIRNLPDKIASMHNGVWDKSATGSYEVRGKKLGIVGYGNIGKQLSILGESMGMKIYYYDVDERLGLGNAKKCRSLRDLLKSCDIISLHVDGRPENKNLIGKREFAQMKKGVIFLNLSRGHVVDIKELRASIENGKVGGSAVDVFPSEPLTNEDAFTSELKGLPNTILTPHIGGSTLEAQMNIAEFVPNRIMEYINTGSTTNSVNFPNLTLPTLTNAHRFIHIHHNQPGVMAHITNTLAEHDINVMGQYLKTNDSIGYVITDINKDYNKDVIKALKKIDGTIRFRVLY